MGWDDRRITFRHPLRGHSYGASMIFGHSARTAGSVLTLLVASQLLVSCDSGPSGRSKGDVALTILTSGVEFDADGYTVNIDGVSGPHATATFGTTLLLSDLAA